MPNYIHECKQCKAKIEIFIKLADFDKPVELLCDCGACDWTRKIFAVPQVGPKFKGHHNGIPKRQLSDIEI